MRCDRRDEAAELTDRFEQEATRPRGRALALRCRGLLAPDDDATELFDQSAELHRRDRSAIYGGFHLYVLREPTA